MADFSRARRTMETADLIERLKALHDLEDARDVPDEETKSALKEAVVQLGNFVDRVESQERLNKAYDVLHNAYKNDALKSSEDPDFKRAASHIRLVGLSGSRLRIAVNAFQKAMDEAGHLTGPKGREIYNLIMGHLQHDLAGQFGMSVDYTIRQAVAALRGLPAETQAD